MSSLLVDDHGPRLDVDRAVVVARAAGLARSDVIAPGAVPGRVQARGRGMRRGWTVARDELPAHLEPEALAHVLGVIREELTAWALAASRSARS